MHKRTLLISGRHPMTCCETAVKLSIFKEVSRMGQFTAFGAAPIGYHIF